MSKDKEYQISQYAFPHVFGRLWGDAEDKNDRLREIQVKRANKSKENIQILSPNPKNISSAHINLSDLQDAGVTQE